MTIIGVSAPRGSLPSGSLPRSGDISDRTLFALAALNFFLADARDGLGPFLDAFLATQWAG